MSRSEKIKAIQAALGVKPDGAWGPLSQGAFDALISPATIPKDPAVHSVRASSFADPADVAAFLRCKAQGKTDQQCFRVGDNGVGKWGDDCTAGAGPMCALPPEDWTALDKPRLSKVEITANGRTITARLGDTMPARKNIRNGAGIDLSPDACKALGLTPPLMVPATWRWAAQT